MISVDWEQIIWRSQMYENDYDQPKRLLAAKVRELCPDCEGTGDRMHNGECIGACGHPNSVTVGDMLDRMVSLLTNDDWIARYNGDDSDFDRGWRTARNNLIAEIRREGPWARHQ